MRRSHFVTAVGFILVGATGCGDAGENVARDQAALGSTWPTPVAISTLQALKNMDMAGNYYLSKDIDGLNGAWSPPGEFMGTLDGRGKTIKNLVITNTNFQAGAFFQTTGSAIIKNIRFTGITVTGNNIAAGVVGVAIDSSLDQVGFQGTVTGSSEAGGLVAYSAGAIIGSYAQATVTGNTTSGTPTAGGIVGEITGGGDMHDVYAVGNVKGRGHVGGLIGNATCSGDDGYFIYNGVYRGGDVVDASRSAWSGAIGDYADCNNGGRLGVFFYDTTSDMSGTHNTSFVGNIGATATQLKTPTTPDGGVYCQFGGGHCMDNGFANPPWNAGTSSQNHTLRGVLDESSQPL